MSNEAQQTNQTQDTRVVLNVVTEQKLEQALTEQWASFKTWVESNIDNSNLMGIVKAKLDQANREVIGTTGTAKADAINVAVNAMVAAFEAAGISMTGIKTSQFAQMIESLTNNNGVYILDSTGLQWTAENWAYQKQQQGHDPATCAGILLSNPDHNILVSSLNYGTMQFGTYSHTLRSLQAMDGGVAGTPKDGTYNSRKIMACTNPNNVKAQYKVNYFSGMDVADLTNKDIVLFESEAQMLSWANTMGLNKMLSLGDVIIYAYPHASVANAWVLKYHKMGVTTITFQQIEAQAPYTDNYGQIGCTALEVCVAHKEHTTDARYWRLPSLFELMLIYLNKNAINACRTALGKALLPSANVWSALQFNVNLEYYLSLADGSYNGYVKNGTCWVIPVAS